MGLSLSHERGKGVEARVSIQCPACFPGPGAESCHNHSLLLARSRSDFQGLSLGAFETAKSGLGIALLQDRHRCSPAEIFCVSLCKSSSVHPPASKASQQYGRPPQYGNDGDDATA
jgi:hypothetical protein